MGLEPEPDNFETDSAAGISSHVIAIMYSVMKLGTPKYFRRLKKIVLNMVSTNNVGTF